MDMKFKNNVMERSQKSPEGGEKKNLKIRSWFTQGPSALQHTHSYTKQRLPDKSLLFRLPEKRNKKKKRANHKEETFRN